MALTNPTFLADGVTFATKNIATAASVYEYTVAADGIIYISVAMTVAGNGDYIAYITHKWLTAGSTYTVLPKTTGTSEATGETTISFVSGAIIVKNTDVINIMIDGLTGDTSVGGIVRIAYHNFSVFQSSDTVTNVTNVATAAAVTTLNGIANGAITAAAIATGAIDADALATDAADEIADHVWDEAIAGHLGAGSTGLKLNTAAAASGAGAITWPYTLTSSVDATPIADANVWVTSDLAGAVVIASGTTNALGVVTFYLDAGTVYIWRQKTGWDFTNPDTEVVS